MKMIQIIGTVVFFALSIFSRASAQTLWSGTAETGTMSDWTRMPGGGEFDSGSGSSSASLDFAHSGSWSYKMTIAAPAGGHSSATRLFRWAESQANRDLYYSIWLYFPADFSLTGNFSNGHFLNLFQFKSKTYDGSRNDPLWAIYVINDCSDANSRTACLTGSTKYLQLGWGSGGATIAGPYSTSDVGIKNFDQTAPNRVALPVGQWTHLEAFLHQSTAASNTSPSNYDGQIIVWQDGVSLWNLTDVATSYPNCGANSWCASNQWSVNNYSDSVNNGADFTLYSDDAQISAAYVP